MHSSSFFIVNFPFCFSPLVTELPHLQLPYSLYYSTLGELSIYCTSEAAHSFNNYSLCYLAVDKNVWVDSPQVFQIHNWYVNKYNSIIAKIFQIVLFIAINLWLIIKNLKAIQFYGVGYFWILLSVCICIYLLLNIFMPVFKRKLRWGYMWIQLPWKHWKTESKTMHWLNTAHAQWK